MSDYNKNDYNREYNKNTYKTVKVYIREEEYPAIMTHMNKKGYIKDLIANDMNQGGYSEEQHNGD